VNFCRRCGTKVIGVFCTVCGAPTSPALTSVGVEATTVSPHDTVVGEADGPDAASVMPTPLTEVDRLPPPPAPAQVMSAALSAVPVLPQGVARKLLVWETRFVMLGFLLPVVTSAIIVLVQHVDEHGSVTRFTSVVRGQPVTNLVLEIFAYLSVAAIVPLALLLLQRTGQSPSVLGLGVPRIKRDIFPGLGLGAAAFATEIAILIPFAGFLTHHSSLVNSVGIGHVPKYYVIGGLAMSATTAIAEEVLVNGYLITRLGQLGWTPRKSLILSLILRTSYHVYYGFGFLLTVPFGFFVTRSFQKHHKLNRPIVAHFLFDAILVSIAILK
jgi:membrane protease YdiL (CAAX protease family)